MQAGGRAHGDVGGGNSLPERQSGGTDQAVVRAQLSAGVAAHTGAGILQRRVGKAVQKVSNVHEDVSQGNAVLGTESHGAFQHGILHQNPHIGHIDGLVNILQT